MQIFLTVLGIWTLNKVIVIKELIVTIHVIFIFINIQYEKMSDDKHHGNITM